MAERVGITTFALPRSGPLAGAPIGMISNGAEREAIMPVPGSPLEPLIP